MLVSLYQPMYVYVHIFMAFNISLSVYVTVSLSLPMFVNLSIFMCLNIYLTFICVCMFMRLSLS